MKLFFINVLYLFGEGVAEIQSKPSAIKFLRFSTPTSVCNSGGPALQTRSGFNLIPIFIKKALNNESLTIRGTGEQKRQFIFVQDLVEGCISTLSEQASNEVFNLVGDKMISVKDVAETVANLIPDTKVEFVPEREGELGYRYVSSDKIKDMLGWSPSTTFESGVKKTIDWYQTK